jgi:DNA primase
MTGLFARAKAAVAIEDVAGRAVKLRGHGAEQRGQCPLCGAGEKSASPPFRIRIARQDFQCFSCEARGDVVDLYAALEKLTPIEAAKRLAGDQPALKDWSPPKPKPPTTDDQREERMRRIAVDALARGVPLSDPTIGRT